MRRIVTGTIAAVVTLVLSSSVIAQSRSTIVVYNQADPEAVQLASHYASARRIPDANIVSIDCSAKNTITRRHFEETIEDPLRSVFERRKWWKTRGGKVIENKIRYVVLIRGVPVRIHHEPAEGHDLEKFPIHGHTGKPKNVSFVGTNAASVDSELAVLGMFNEKKEGWISNPYYNSNDQFDRASIPELMLVCRLDGPTSADVRRMIDDTIRVEKTGLWGRAYIDFLNDYSGFPGGGSGGYKIGDEMLQEAFDSLKAGGMPMFRDDNRHRFPHSFPMSNAAVYMGWYTQNADGPFKNPDFKMQPGAIGCHIYSYSAKNLRSGAWVAPLVKHGATAVLGNVYEPLLSQVTHLGAFTKRLTEGYTFAESAYVATPSLSWMTVMVGDPLYRPFHQVKRTGLEEYGKDEFTRYRIYRSAYRRWAENPQLFEKSIEAAARNRKDGFLTEALGAYHRERGFDGKASVYFHRAAEQFTEPVDRLRVQLWLADMAQAEGSKKGAAKILREAIEAYPDVPEAKAAQALLNIVDPPPPPPPKPEKEADKEPKRPAA